MKQIKNINKWIKKADKLFKSTLKEINKSISASPTAISLKLNNPAQLALMVWPMLWGFCSSVNSDFGFLPFAIFLTIALRSASCVYDDFVNQLEVDKKPSLTLLISLIFVCAWTALALSSLTFLLVIMWAFMVIAYPYISKITWSPQLYIGLVFGAWPVLMGQSMAGSIDFNVVIVMISAFFWIAAMETLRAGTSLDLEEKLKEFTMVLGKRKVSLINIALASSFVFLVINGLIAGNSGFFYVLLMLSQVVMVKVFQADKVDCSDEEVSCNTYKASMIAGLLIAVGFVLS